jgi:hypothetical protein
MLQAISNGNLPVTGCLRQGLPASHVRKLRADLAGLQSLLGSATQQAMCGLCGSTGACLCIQLVPIPVGVAVLRGAVVHEGAG